MYEITKITGLEHYRMGQFLFNFLTWLKAEKGYSSEVSWVNGVPHVSDTRMADPFNIPDQVLAAYLDEYNASLI